MALNDHEVHLLMKHYQRTLNFEMAGAKVKVCRQTASKHVKSGLLPSECQQPRDYRTRTDPFKEVWAEVAAKLELAPGLRGKELFEWLCERYPGKFSPGQLRPFQRRINQWRALYGPGQIATCPQDHPPGKCMALDFTNANELGITINGEPFNHLLGHCTLTYSNWCWATIASSESLLAIKQTLQDALFRLCATPLELLMDNSTAATHNPGQTGSKR